MDKAQFEKWFSEERLQITKERRQKLVSGVPHMPPHRRATPQLVVGARTGTPLYVQRQLVDHVGTLSPPPPVQTQPTQHVLSQVSSIISHFYSSNKVQCHLTCLAGRSYLSDGDESGEQWGSDDADHHDCANFQKPASRIEAHRRY